MRASVGSFSHSRKTWTGAGRDSPPLPHLCCCSVYVCVCGYQCVYPGLSCCCGGGGGGAQGCSLLLCCPLQTRLPAAPAAPAASPSPPTGPWALAPPTGPWAPPPTLLTTASQRRRASPRWAPPSALLSRAPLLLSKLSAVPDEDEEAPQEQRSRVGGGLL